MNNNRPILLQFMWKANQSHGLHVASLSIITISLAPWKLQENQKNNNNKLFQQICDSPYFETPIENFQQNCVCVCERERESERENFGTKVCMYVCMWDDKLCL